MKEIKLINVLKTFTAEEMKLFEKYIISPFHSRGKNCLPLLKQLRKFYPDFTGEKLTYEDIYKNIYPGKKYNKQVMYNLSSEMEKMTRGFLEQIALRKKTFRRTDLLLSEFGTRKLLDNYFETINVMEKQLAGGTIDYFYIENMAQLEGHKLDYFYLVDKVHSMTDSKLKDSEYHILLFLRMITGGLHDMGILSRNMNAKFNVNLPLELAKDLDLKKLSDYAAQSKYKYAFLIEIYYHAITMILKPELDEHFNRLYELYKRHYNKFSISEKRNMMYWLITYSRLREDEDAAGYDRITFELNKFRLEEGLVFYPEKQIPKGVYRNIFTSALKVGETKWAENFVKEYTSRLKKEYRIPVSSLANASLYFILGSYGKVLENLNKIVFIDQGDKVIAKSLIAKTYYEMGETESLLHHIDSFLHFVNNTESLSMAYRKSYRNFLKYLKRLISVKENYDIHLLSRFEYELLSLKDLYEKKWLLIKAGELKK